MLYAGLTQPLEGPGITKRYQLGKSHCAGKESWGAAALPALLCKGRCKGNVQECIRSWGPNQKKVLCQLVCILAALPARLRCPCAQKCCSFIHTSAKKTPRKPQLNKLFITNDSFVAISFSAVQHIIGMYFCRQKGKNKNVNYSSHSAWGLCFPCVVVEQNEVLIVLWAESTSPLHK